MTSTDTTSETRSLHLATGFAIVAAGVIGLDWLMLGDGGSLTREGGSVETMSMLGYIYALVIYLWRARPVFWPVPVILLFMAAREGDLDKALTSEGILSTKILLYDTALWEKSLAVAIWVLLIAALITLARYRAPLLWRDLRRGAPWALLFLAGLFIAAFSKTIDGLGRKLGTFGVEVATEVVQGSGIIEETLELLIPILFVMAICLRTRKPT
ncbi:hypothetical protein SAMN05428995_101165 [Loktanella sp. DSM 29012]|uniref:hypothetical protein n=1 Tax=Loktanella sp. DSM 29012 TaxID=1881056 RepID=UPI0008CD9EFC|nr:hypothetical protein [Loktanella sp. DSM 29012]SEP58158.1 hypothetical protein SAMN05428995_101165 [Loktanella sp. DSM 29012]